MEMWVGEMGGRGNSWGSSLTENHGPWLPCLQCTAQGNAPFFFNRFDLRWPFGGEWALLRVHFPLQEPGGDIRYLPYSLRSALNMGLGSSL